MSREWVTSMELHSLPLVYFKSYVVRKKFLSLYSKVNYFADFFPVQWIDLKSRSLIATNECINWERTKNLVERYKIEINKHIGNTFCACSLLYGLHSTASCTSVVCVQVTDFTPHFACLYRLFLCHCYWYWVKCKCAVSKLNLFLL